MSDESTNNFSITNMPRSRISNSTCHCVLHPQLLSAQIRHFMAHSYLDCFRHHSSSSRTSVFQPGHQDRHTSPVNTQSRLHTSRCKDGKNHTIPTTPTATGKSKVGMTSNPWTKLKLKYKLQHNPQATLPILHQHKPQPQPPLLPPPQPPPHQHQQYAPAPYPSARYG